MEQDKTYVNAEALDEVAGGADTQGECRFASSGYTKVWDNKTWIRCGSDCHSKKCSCHGKVWCIDKWHWIHDDDKFLYLKDFYNHRWKDPNKSYRA